VTATCKEPTSFPICDPGNWVNIRYNLCNKCLFKFKSPLDPLGDESNSQLNEDKIAEGLRSYISSARHLTLFTTTTTSTFTTTSYCTYSTTALTTCVSIPFGKSLVLERRRRLLNRDDNNKLEDSSVFSDLPKLDEQYRWINIYIFFLWW
jgi:hypothetical protein